PLSLLLLLPPPPTSTLFPYTTLFRSPRRRDDRAAEDHLARQALQPRAHDDVRKRLPSLAGGRKRPAHRDGIGTRRARAGARGYRSEEHTSELQSRSDLVCRLLLEKKK